jgi:hypothetical protein
MKHALCCQVRGVGLLWRVKVANVGLFSVQLNPCLKPAITRPDAKNAKFVARSRAFLVLQIHASRYVAQVCNSIICAITINVVNIGFGPLCVHVQPRKAVRQKFCIAGSNDNVPKLIDAAHLRAFFTSAPRFAPRKKSRFWIVVQQLTQALCGNIGLSHDASFPLIGQRPVSVTSAAPALPFYTMVA